MIPLRPLAFLSAILLAAAPLGAAEATLRLDASAHAPGEPLVPHWSLCVGAGRANEGLRAGWLEHMKLVHDACGFRYVRFHGLFHGDMFAYRESKEGPIYNWQYIDELFDRLLAIGVRPFVEFGFNPIDPLPEGWKGQFWWRGNASPPRDLEKWSALIDAFLRHCVARYGLDEVRQWYFEVWNEPNLDPFFHGGTQSQYFQLYRATALAVKKVDPQFRVGGPATSNFQVRGIGGAAGKGRAVRVDRPDGARPEDAEALDWQPVWIEDFLSYCRQHELPLDFISTHPYPTDFPFDDGKGRIVKVRRPVDATRNDLTLLRRMVDAGPYPKAGIHLTEWSSSPSSRDFTHDVLPAAAFVVKANVESAGRVDSLAYWTFTDVFEESGAGHTIFHGGFGLVNYQGIVKPTFHAYRFLHALGDEVLAQSPGGIVSRHRDTGRLTALLYNYPADMKVSLPSTGKLAEALELANQGRPLEAEITLRGLPPGARLRVETLDQSHGNAVAAWQKMGSPEPPTREQTAELRRAAAATRRETLAADAAGRFHLERSLAPWSVVLIAEEKP